MPTFTLTQALALTREEILTFSGSGDYTYIDGYTGDPAITSPATYISLTNKINQAIFDILMATKFNQSIQTVSLVNGTAIYAIPTGVFSIRSAYIGNVRLRQTTIEEQDRRNFRWRTNTGLPQMYYTTSMNSIGVTPVPTTSYTMYLNCVSDFTPLAAGSDTIPTTLPGAFQYLVPIRAALLCALADAGNENAQVRAKQLSARYAEGMTVLMAEIKLRQDDEDAPQVVKRLPNNKDLGQQGDDPNG